MTRVASTTASPVDAGVAAPLLAWFDRHARDLPWRRAPSPYRTLVSEFMLQQTVVATVIPYFESFLARWPDVTALAAATEEQVLAAWSGLGYYSRARNLHRAATAVVQRHGGALPADEEALRALPGVGPYTAAAIASIAFGQRTFALDGNAARVVARLHALREPIDLPSTRVRLRALGQAMVPARRAGAFMEAVMELGATVCTPRAPSCDACPLARACQARRLGRVAELPVKSPPRPKQPVSAVCARVQQAGRVLLLRRGQGLLAGTWTLPTCERTGRGPADGAALACAAAAEVLGANASKLRARRAGEVRHVFTHRDLLAEVYDVEGPAPAQRLRDGALPSDPDVRWASAADLGSMAVSSLLRKLLAAGSSTDTLPRRRGKATKATMTANSRRNGA